MRRLILNFGLIWGLLMYVRQRSLLLFLLDIVADLLDIVAGEQTIDV
jgi:hypothetical protein